MKLLSILRASFVFLGPFAAAGASQTIPDLSCWPQARYDDGVAVTQWKINYPAQTGDRYNVDFNADLAGLTIVGMSIGLSSTRYGGGSLGQIAFCTSNLAVDPTGTTPDAVNGVISGVSKWGASGVPASSAGFCPGVVGLDLPDFVAGTDVHAVMSMATGDTTTWLCADGSPVAGRSYFTANDYSSPAIPMSLNWILRAVYAGSPGSFTINAQTSLGIVDDAELTFQFWGTTGTTEYLQGILIGAAFFPVPAMILPTGVCNFAPPGLGPDNGALQGSLAGLCPPVGTSLSFAAFWLDPTTLKPNGHPKIRITNPATITVTSNSRGCRGPNCYGKLDDGVYDGNAWKVNFPSGNGDWFNVRLDPVPSVVSNYLAMEAACWDFNGTGGMFRRAGLYHANLGLDPTGDTLDPNNPVSSVGLSSAKVAPGAAQWGFPATIFDFTDVAATQGSVLHLGLAFQTGDSNLWLGTDSDATDGNVGCAFLPNSTSFFSSSNYFSPASPLSTSNLMMRLDWN